MARLLMALVVMALLVGACAFYPDDGGGVRRDDPRRVVVTVAPGSGGGPEVRPMEPRPTPEPTEYRGTPVISWCMATVCKPPAKKR